jgi:hypothetical protein
MRSTELHGERRGWNLHLVGRVVCFMGRVVCFWRIFLEVWIFRNVWDEFQNSVTNHFTAAAAKREDGITHQEHAGARLVLVAYFVDPGLLNQFSWSQGAIGLVKCFDVCVLQSHIGACFCSFLQPSGARRAREQLVHEKWDALRVTTSWCPMLLRTLFAILFSGNPA